KAEKDKADKAEKSADKVEKGDKTEKSDKPVKTAEKTPDKAEKPKGDKADKLDKGDKPVLTAMTDDDLDKPEASAGKPELLAAKEPKGEGDAAKKKADAKSPAASAQAQKPLPPTKAQVVQSTPNPANKKGDAVKKADPLQSHFTLQLSAFPDKSDAEEFMHKIQTAGYKPFLVASEIPGKGVFFRVRVGDYASRQSAVDAKAEFERKQRIIAYVAKL
ncbi:MAG TPA: SPOR domain-containing protein, partial [Polyangia bacterium]|nr:SPOR domain-containing protein [Polyangia bacterium]